MTTIKIDSWNQLNDELFKDWWWPKIGRFRAPLAFRGISDCNYKLETTLMRLGGNYRKTEPHMLRNFKKYASKDITKYSGQEITKFDSIWHWMVVGQHYGLPTRLLDWTYSPLVAMYFATRNLDKINVDAAIWIVDFIQVIRYLPKEFKQILMERDSRVFTIDILMDLLSGKTEGLQNLEDYGKSDYALFIEPPSIDERIVNQFAMGSFMSNPELCMDDWLQNHNDPKLWRKIIIPADLKVEIRDKLAQSNITARTMFPGLGGVCEWLAMYYSPGLTK